MNRRRSDYPCLPLLKAITSASEGELHRLTRFWVYGDGSQTDGGSFPFLFINGGAATLSGSTLSAVIVKDTITQRKIQLLNHTGIRRLYFFSDNFDVQNIHSNSQPPCLCDGTSRFPSKIRTHRPPVHEGLPRFKHQVQHRDGGSGT